MSGFVLPKGYSASVIPKYNDQQQDFLKNLLSKLGASSMGAADQLGSMASGQGGAFDNMENQAMNFFNNKLAPSINQQYAHQGMLGSSAFQGALSQAGQGVTEDMYNQRQNLQQQAIRDLLGLSERLGTTQMSEYGVFAKPKKDKFNFGTLASLIGKFLL